GATNVLRLGGKKAAALTLLGDVLKAVLPVLLARAAGASEAVVTATAVAAVVGHIFPVFFHFRGGKGVATLFGAVASLSWPVAVGMGIAWLAVAAALRYSSLASLVAAVAAPALALWLSPRPAYVVGLVALALLLLWRHKTNIARLLGGTENRIGEKSKATTAG
ncbi:MAG: glycerol-3-phosphate 1-O-acyltransferase PlsY, partial [Gammaproteobacteria bacterium]